MANIYRGGMQISGNSGGGSINTSQLTQNILDGVEEIIRPSGHQYPNVNLYPVQMTPRFLIPQAGSATLNYMTTVYSEAPQLDLSNPDHLYILENLDISRFQNISQVFFGIKSQSGILIDLSGWDVSNVKIAECLFYSMVSTSSHVGAFNLNNWDVRNIRDMNHMFAGHPSNSNSGVSSNYYILDSLSLSNWNVTNVSRMDYMFINIRVPELDLSTWDMSYVTSFNYMFDDVVNSSRPAVLEKLLWGGAVNAIDLDSYNPALDLSKTILTPTNANLFFQSLATKTSSGTTTIKMPTTAQGADLSIAEAKGYTITNITQP